MLAVDFGSSNTAAAFRDSRGGVHQISLSHNGWLMPSAVLYSTDRTLVGRTAVQGFLTDPDGYEPSPKRRLAEREIHLGPGIVAVTDLIAAVLREVVAKAQREMGSLPDRVVLTHPDKWALPMQELLREAAVQAGLDGSEIRLISEASAAAWYYTVTRRELPVGARLAVFDFGAGTCDVAVLDKQQDQTFSVIASDGVDGLGGYDLDARIHRWVRDQLAQTDPQLADELAQPGAIASRLTLNDRIRDAKEALSEAPKAVIAVANGARTQLLTLTRDEFDHLISSDLDRAVDLTERVLADAQRIRPIDGKPTIYLTGGSSMIPAVHNRLRTLGSLGELGDPKTVVSQGALHAMGMLWDDDRLTVNFPKMPNPEKRPSPPPEPIPPSPPTEPASSPEIPWYLQKPDRPAQPPSRPRIPTMQGDGRSGGGPVARDQRPHSGPNPLPVPQQPVPQPPVPQQPVPKPQPQVPPSQPKLPQQQPPIVRPHPHPQPQPDSKMPWVIAGLIILIAVVVAVVAIAMAL